MTDNEIDAIWEQTPWADIRLDDADHQTELRRRFARAIEQAARATAEQSEPLTREQILDLCCEFGQDFINGHCTDVWGLLIHLYGLERALKSQQDAAIESHGNV